MRANFGALGDAVIERYPCSHLNPISGQSAYVAAISAAFFTCPSRRAAAAAAKSQTEPVYRYLFTHRYDYGPLFALGAFHTGELPFVFDTFGALAYIPTPSESALSKSIRHRWAAFARTGAPHDGGALAWPRYDGALDNALALDTDAHVVNGFDDAGCDLWDSVQ